MIEVHIVPAGDFLMMMSHPMFKRLSRLSGRYGETILVTLEPPEDVVTTHLANHCHTPIAGARRS